MRTPRTIVLMYHRVTDNPVDPTEGDYVLSTDGFEAQMRWLADRDWAVVPLPALLEEGRPHRSVVLTFDDGCDSDATLVAPLLEELDFPATFFVSPARLGKPGYLSWDQLRGLALRGFAVGSHGLDHSFFAGLTEPELRKQLVQSKRWLEERLERPIDALSLPGGSGGARALRAAHDAGFGLVVGSRPGCVQGVAPRAVLPRFAIRSGHGLRGFHAAVEQKTLFRVRHGLRYGAAKLARSLIGTADYGRLRAGWLRRSASASRGRRE